MIGSKKKDLILEQLLKLKFKLRFTWISTPFVRGTSLCTKCTERTIPSICDVIENAIYFTFLHFFFFQVHDGRVENGTVQT